MSGLLITSGLSSDFRGKINLKSNLHFNFFAASLFHENISTAGIKLFHRICQYLRALDALECMSVIFTNRIASKTVSILQILLCSHIRVTGFDFLYFLCSLY